jgi:DNA helicase-2/ATP-dependent DNA helicase PcrA
MEILEGLTEAQKRAVTHGDGPLLVVAGAGSGKTRVITRRIAHLIHHGADPRSILAITFTNKAAGEMADRVAQLGVSKGAWVSTFHSFCARILRMYGERIGLARDFSIFDETDTRRCVKTTLSELGLDSTNWPPRKMRAHISRIKNELEQGICDLESGGFREKTIAKVIRRYNDVLARNGALDFDDLLGKTAELLEDDESRRMLQNRFRYILIDEYQDTNHAQYTIARRLTGAGCNICATGDPDQSIYGWRGADISNILNFEKDFPEVTVIKLEANFRSRKEILSAASTLIANNSARIERDLKATLEEPGTVAVTELHDEQDEASHIVKGVTGLIEKGSKAGQCAVFYRVNAMSRALEDAFAEAGVPYVIVGGVEFYRRKEVKDVLSYLRAILNREDDISFERIVNNPPRGIGKVTIEKLRVKAALEGSGLNGFLRERRYGGLAGSAAQKKLDAFAELMDAIEAAMEGSAADAVRKVIDLTGYEASVSEDEPDRLENLAELVTAAQRFDSTDEEGGVRGFLEKAALVSDIDDYEGPTDKVVLMTVHAAKGLEFDHVFIAGLEEGLFPHDRSLARTKDIEEERRLCYVALTRARKTTVLTHVRLRMIHGTSCAQMPSRFLGELPSDCVTWQKLELPKLDSSAGLWDMEQPEAGFGLAAGDRVRHNTFGVGRVISISGLGENTRATVDFLRAGRKRLVLRHARLERLSGAER